MVGGKGRGHSGWNLTQFPDHMCDFFLADRGLKCSPSQLHQRRLSELCGELTSTTDIDYAKEVGYEMQTILAQNEHTGTFFSTRPDAYKSLMCRTPFLEVWGA